VLPLFVVIGVNLLMSMFVLPRLDFSFLAEERWGSTSLSAVAGVWAVVVALATAILTLVLANLPRLPALRESMDAGGNAAVLPALSVASLVGFGAVVAMLPAFATVRDWVLSIGGGPLVSLAAAVNVLAALTGSASGGLTIALDALGRTYTETRGAARDRSRADAPRSRDRLGHARQPPPQRCRGDAAGRLRHDSSRKLSRYRNRRDPRRGHRACRSDCAWLGSGIVLREQRCP
jgi:hypothetical protein